ncbi:MAG: acetyl/propionyl/methylcrotonyl-CoA carboxylase subunit alpha [Hyphomicrobiales bacterium]|nr:acetyl/propionyl/methylcrotonyl-CoA carboxylase subunit alpha [Hyphomicrobiales bacterium]
MFKKILIANRGEIACRIMDTASQMGIKTVAVYSDADAEALHVLEADEAINIGPAAALESYLCGDKIVDAAKRTGAEAIHPGYGFLSENPDFVEAVLAAGLVFIGPSADAIRAMGLKDAAKNLMERSGVPVVPGYHRDIQDAQFLAVEAKKIGYPVLIKARSGGGGKGMRLVQNSSEFVGALEGAVSEGKASFGDGHVLIEKFISSPRHIEIQVFGDNHGNVVHMFERDCSLQRRHQKVIEEAPAPGMSEEMRSAMGEAAVKAAKSVDYSGAGTVEFIVDGSEGLQPDRFWFMEMNTRLQVEHPVTEMITGLDLVELQLKVAYDEPLPFSQEDLSINGWAFEARIYAEDAAKGFLPSIGRLNYFEMPDDFARIDCGVSEGGEISPYYDPMIGKVITHGEDRHQALANMRAALDQTYIAGVTTNVGFLAALCHDEDFSKSHVDTGLINRRLDSLISCGEAKSIDIAVGAVMLFLQRLENERASFGSEFDGWRAWGTGNFYIDLIHLEQNHFCAVRVIGEDRYEVEIENDSIALQLKPEFSDDDFSQKIKVEWSQGNFTVACVETDDGITVIGNARAFTYKLIDPLEADNTEVANASLIRAPMPGLAKSVKVGIGEHVVEGQVLVILEAMKMEHSLVAPRDGEIESVHIDEGDQVDDAALLILLKEIQSE